MALTALSGKGKTGTPALSRASISA
jgi:hypothetical protein